MEDGLFSNLKAVVFKFKKRFSIGLFLVLLSNAFLLLNPLLFREALYSMGDESSKAALSPLFKEIRLFDSGNVFAWGTLLLSFALLSTFLKYKMRIAFISISREAEADIREKIYLRIQNQSQEFFDRYGIGELLSRLTNDITRYRDVIGPGLMYPFFGLTLIIPGVIILFYISWELALFSLVPIIAIPLAYYFIHGKIYKASDTVLSKYSLLSNYAEEHYSGIRVVKANSVEKKLQSLFTQLGFSLIEPSVYLATVEGTFYPLIAAFTRASPVVILFLTAFLTYYFGKSFSTADILSFVWVQSYIYGPVLMLSWVFPSYETGRASFDRLKKIYDEPIRLAESLFPIRIEEKEISLDVRNLSFKYPLTKEFALKNVSFSVKPGEHIGITGPIGSGKTTLFKILSRAYDIESGKVFFSGTDIKDISLKQIYELHVLCEQIPFLFSKSIADNVRFANEDATMEELELVLKFADLHETVLSFPDQYQTMIGERGVMLSGGQKMRLALARAFLLKRPLLLFDDIFSSVDAKTEDHILSSIKNFFKGRTLFLISQRVSALEKMDRLFYFQGGEIIEEGTPYDLKRKMGKYRSLYELSRMREENK